MISEFHCRRAIVQMALSARPLMQRLPTASGRVQWLFIPNRDVHPTLSNIHVALPKIWYRLQMLGPISSYCAFVWQNE